MKKNDFENRLQNDLFPQMPASFGRKLTEALGSEGVQVKKRPTAKGLLAGALGVVAAAACLVMVLVSVLGGGKSKLNAAAPGDATATSQTPIPSPAVTEAPYTWDWNPKIITLSTGFEFTDQVKTEALYTSILEYLKQKGESEPDELWLCAIQNQYVKEDTGYRSDGYLSGYYVLAQHAFGPGDGPELYCLGDDFEVLWATEGSSPGPNHAVNPEQDSYAAAYQGHFVYGMAPTDAHVTRGALVGTNPKEKTDIEFSMRAWFPNLGERLKESHHADVAREYFLVTVPASSWDSVMQNPILRFETEEGNVDVNMETDLPLANVVLAPRLSLDSNQWSPDAQPDESGLPMAETVVLDLTDDRYGPEAVQTYADAILRALRVMDLGTPRELWICGVAYDLEKQDGTPPDYVYILAEYAFDGGPFPELFYYNHGVIEWMTLGAETYDVNVVHNNGNTLAFAVSPAYDGEPLAMNEASLNVKDAAIYPIAPQLPLEQVRQRVPQGPHSFAAREYFLWLGDGEELEVKALNVTASKDGRSRSFTLDTVNVLEPQPVPAMTVESDGVIYPGMVTHPIYSLDENGVSSDGEPLAETLSNGLLFMEKKVWHRPLTIITASDNVTVDRVRVLGVASGDNAEGETDQLQIDGADLELDQIDALPAGEYYLCFRTTTLGPYSEKIGRYTYQTDYTIYKVTLE